MGRRYKAVERIRYTIRYIRRHKFLCLCGLLIPALSSMATNIFYANRLQAYSEKILLDNFLLHDVAMLLGMTVVVLLILSAIDDVGRYICELFAASTDCEIKQDYYNGLVNSSMNSLNDYNKGELISKYNLDTARSTNMFTYDINGILYPLIVGSAYFIAVLLVNRFIGMIMLGLGVSVIIFNFLYLKKMMNIQEEILKANEVYTLNCNNTIQGKMSIRQYMAGKTMSNKIKDSSLVINKKDKKAVKLETIKTLTVDGMANTCIYLLTPVACVFAVKGYIEVPVVLFVHQICRCFIQYTQNFANAFISFKTNSLSFERILSIIELPKENELVEDREIKEFPSNVSVEYENVNVSYGNKNVLRNVSFKVDSGTIVGISGASGSGKSTLIKSLLHVVNYKGRILIGGIDTKDLSLKELRSHISYSPEHSDLFHDSVRENIRFGDKNVTEDTLCSVVDSLAIENVEDFLSRDVGEKGGYLSGGQKQKVSLARAIIKNAPIVILDEPTAALDTNSEKKVLDMILNLKKSGKIVFLITHKESTLRIADRILYLENGTICTNKEGKNENE